MRRLEYVSDGAGKRMSAAFTGMALELRHRDRVPGMADAGGSGLRLGMEPQDDGFGARNVGRPKETLADLDRSIRSLYSEMMEQVDRSIRSLRLGVARMPLAGAATERDLSRLTDLLRALEAAESLMEDAGP